MKKQIDEDPLQLKLHKIGKSQITIWHRPSKKQIHHLKALEYTTIITLQSKKEFPEEIQDTCLPLQINWIHIQLDGANLPLLQNPITIQNIQEKLIQVYNLLYESEEKVLIHCAAGIHRTGTFTYCLLRMQGYDQQNAMVQLQNLRECTFKGVGSHRIELAEKLILNNSTIQQLILNSQQVFKK